MNIHNLLFLLWFDHVGSFLLAIASLAGVGVCIFGGETYNGAFIAFLLASLLFSSLASLSWAIRLGVRNLDARIADLERKLTEAKTSVSDCKHRPGNCHESTQAL